MSRKLIGELALATAIISYASAILLARAIRNACMGD
jgi:hypothetical protein